MRTSDPALAALIDIVRDPSARSLPRDRRVLDRTIELAVEHRVPRSVAQAMEVAGVEVPRELAEQLVVARARHLRSLRSLERAGTALDVAGVRWAVVKGPALAMRWHDDPTSRPYDDLDLLVDPEGLREAVVALTGVGFEHRNSNWKGFVELGVGEVPLDDGTTVLDLHWHLIGLGRHRQDFHLPTADLLDRSVEVHLGGVLARTLDAADTLTHLCLHHALAGSRRLGQLRDVHLVASVVPADDAVERLSTARAQRLAAPVLDRAERAFGAPGGQSTAARSLGEGAWTSVNRAIDAAWVRYNPWRPPSFPGAVVAAGRDTWPFTARAMWQRAIHSVRAKSGLTTVVSDGGPLDWNHSSGGSVERERFFADVAAGRYGR